ncbi:GDSL-like Lipase/Acylhydrolase [Chryseobacterium gleum]|uniref:GDSL-like Lipase/Acylhydrolase n=2 Tax=Chryseobacterium gleum TaxID=250 RepID=A0A448B0R5_CHRGE|nr:GDSL-type esterase/lipase family protein [Chryseobacterium gleum]EFK33723.1 GDSL-like protein [Chryseobacterium gleum ATCC 35910]QQY34475.1 SGNH/GDSL hydrolase family protein [Chryseobacterium gleum]VEE06486.1 GDSL-like Lipase/Acylhydrolase [Chryseobacterium gleum]
MKKITYGLFFGDSITYGEYDGVFGGWVDILKRYALQKFHEGNGDELILFNLGIGGETTEGLLKRIPHELEARNSADGNIIFLSYGANDLAIKDGKQVVEPEKFKNNITTAVNHARQFSNEIYLVSILPFSERVDGVVVSSGKLRTNEEVIVYNQILKDLAAEHSLGYIDFYSAFLEDKEILLSADGVHPNEKGYGMMAEVAIPIIEKYL